MNKKILTKKLKYVFKDKTIIEIDFNKFSDSQLLSLKVELLKYMELIDS